MQNSFRTNLDDNKIQLSKQRGGNRTLLPMQPCSSWMVPHGVLTAAGRGLGNGTWMASSTYITRSMGKSQLARIICFGMLWSEGSISSETLISGQMFTIKMQF